jgi:hypothetical protein
MTDDPSRKQDRAWRRAHGLTGFRQVRPGVYERQVMDQRLRKGILRGLPPDSLVMMLVQGDDPLGLYGERRRALVWRNMSLAKRPSRVLLLDALQPADPRRFAKARAKAEFVRIAAARHRVVSCPHRDDATVSAGM